MVIIRRNAKWRSVYRKRYSFQRILSKKVIKLKEFHAIPEHISDMKNHVMVTGKYQGISKKGKSFEVSFSHVYHIKDNKIVQFKQFTDTGKITESL